MGRPKGALNKRTAQIALAAAEGGMTPIEYMLDVMRDPGADVQRRDDMAKAAAPYIHPRLQAIGGDDSMPPVNVRTIITGVPRAGDPEP